MARILVILFALLGPAAGAEYADDASGWLYVKISPRLVIKYGETSINRLRYAKGGMSIRVSEDDASDALGTSWIYCRTA